MTNPNEVKPLSVDASGFPMLAANRQSISFRKPVQGIGINDAGFHVEAEVNGKKIIHPIYSVWKGMFARCYSEASHRKEPTYKECSVSDEWLRFTSFYDWALRQDWSGKALDKDILVSGNKEYGPDKCLFVSQPINALLLDRRNCRGDLPIGVTVYNDRGAKRLRASMKADGKHCHLGYFITVNDASRAYLDAKSERVFEVALNQEEPLKSALIRISGEIKKGEYYD